MFETFCDLGILNLDSASTPNLTSHYWSYVF